MKAPTLTERQMAAREAFDIDEAMAALPSAGPSASRLGAAGVRLSRHIVADISDELLREFARETLGASRCSEQYLDALRIILGNQADAERHGYALEMNQRVDFAPPNVMRTIVGQMKAAGIGWGQVVSLGRGRSQVVHCFGVRQEPRTDGKAEDLEPLYRKTEAEDDRRREAAESRGEFQQPADAYAFIDEVDVPY